MVVLVVRLHGEPLGIHPAWRRRTRTAVVARTECPVLHPAVRTMHTMPRWQTKATTHIKKVPKTHWLAHICRMPDEALTKRLLFSQPSGTANPNIRRPTWMSVIRNDLERAGLTDNYYELANSNPKSSRKSRIQAHLLHRKLMGDGDITFPNTNAWPWKLNGKVFFTTKSGSNKMCSGTISGSKKTVVTGVCQVSVSFVLHFLLFVTQ